MIERWDPVLHLGLLGSWLRGWEQAPNAGDARLYPPTGYLVDRCAIGFLYTTNAPLVGYLDGLVTDPAVSARRRYDAIQSLIVLLKHDAAMAGIKLRCMATKVKGLAGMCRDFGFVSYGDDFHYLTNYEDD